MLLTECIVSQYGRTCFLNDTYNVNLNLNVFRMENFLMYLILRPVENIIWKTINGINFAEFSINVEDLDNVPFT